MTQWGTAYVAQVARAAGFTGESLHDAVALAMAASGGADHYRHNPITVPGAERRGLFAIRVDEVPAELVADLFDPAANAGVARALYGLSGASFGWHPTWISGAAGRLRPAIVLHLAGKGRRNGPVSGQSWPVQKHYLVAHAEAMARTLDHGESPLYG
jgi:hypothetical protein